MKHCCSLVAIVTALLYAGQASAQIITNGQASARIVSGLSITQTSTLEFNEILSNGSGGSVSISASGATTYDGVNAFPGSKTPQAAQFHVRGEANKHYTAQLPEEIAISNNQNQRLTIHNFSVNSKRGYTLDGYGVDVLTVGATLNVSANQQGGLYQGQFRVTINYN